MTASRRQRLVLFALVASCAAGAAPGAERSGHPSPWPAPAIEVESVIQGPPEAAAFLRAPSGEALVLEFWATWCGPCVAAIPHWNDLAARFSSESVRFVSVSDESEETLREFLGERPIAGWVVTDTDRSAFRLYGVSGIPRTVLVDRRGRVRAVTYPAHLDEKAIKDLLKGKAPRVPPVVAARSMLALPVGEQEGPAPIVHALVRPAAGGPSDYRMMAQDGQFVAFGVSVTEALTSAWGIHPSRIVIDGEFPEMTYDLSFSAGGAKDQLAPLMQRTLEAAFDMTAALEPRRMEVYVLTAAGEAGGLLKPAVEKAGRYRSSAKTQVEGTGQTSEEIARALEGALGRPVVDATGLQGRYDFRVVWTEGADAAGILEAIRTQTGLAAAPEQREIEVLVIRPRG